MYKLFLNNKNNEYIYYYFFNVCFFTIYIYIYNMQIHTIDKHIL